MLLINKGVSPLVRIPAVTDCMSATCKNHIRMYINEGHDVTNVQQMKTAILSHVGVEGVRVAVVEASINETPE